MQKIKKDRCGYYYADVTPQQIYLWGGLARCDLCGEKIENKGKIGKLVLVLGGCLCEKCFDEWETRNILYESDLILQEEKKKRYYECYLGKEIEFDD